MAQTLSDAFAVDPHIGWFMRDDERRHAARLGFFRMLVAMGAPQGRIDRPAGGGAAAIWMPFEWLGPTPFIAELRSIPSMLRATGWRRFSRMQAVRADMDKHHPMERRHAYLWFLGVAPAAQGRGVGSALLRAANARLGRRVACPPTWRRPEPLRNVATPTPPPRLRGDLGTQGPRRRPDDVEHVAGAGRRPSPTSSWRVGGLWVRT